MDLITGARRAFSASGVALLLSTPGVPHRQVEVGRDAEVVGRVVGLDGTPLADLPMTVILTDTGVTLPLIMPGRDTETVTDTTSAADGSYRVVLPSAYIPGEETDYDWIVKASRPARSGEVGGPNSSFEFEVNTAVQEAPDLVLWDSTPAVSVDGYRVEVSVPDGEPPGTYASWVSVGYGVAKGTSAVFDLRTLEPDYVFESFEYDLVTSGRALADVTVPHSEGRTIYHQEMRTPAVEVSPSVRRLPVSREAPCQLALVDGSVVAVADYCDATDGDLDRPLRPPLGEPYTPDTAPRADVEAVTVELEAATTVGSVSVRGCDEGCTAQLSVDGSTWTDPIEVVVEALFSYSLGDESILIATFDPAGPARFVRVSLPGGTLSATEVSVWPPPAPPAPPPTLAAVVPAIASPAPPPAATGAPASPLPLGAPLAALALLGAVAAALWREFSWRRAAW